MHEDRRYLNLPPKIDMERQVHSQFTSSEASALHRPLSDDEKAGQIPTQSSCVVLAVPATAKETEALSAFQKPEAAISVLESNASSLNVNSTSPHVKSWKTSALNVTDSKPYPRQGSDSNVRP